MGDEATGTSDGMATAPDGIDRGGVEAWFEQHVEGVELPLSFERISGGHSNLTYGVTDAAGRRWALRRPPLGKRLGSAHDMAREHKVVSALGPTAVPVAPVVALCEDESVNEAPFYVMEVVEGPILRGLADVGLLMVYWPRRGEDPVALGQPANLAPGFPTNEELRDRYAERSGRDLSQLGFFEALGYWKLAIILEGVYARYAAGQYGKVDPGIEHFARLVDRLAEAPEAADRKD